MGTHEHTPVQVLVPLPDVEVWVAVTCGAVVCKSQGLVNPYGDSVPQQNEQECRWQAGRVQDQARNGRGLQGLLDTSGLWLKVRHEAKLERRIPMWSEGVCLP
jgi:hypothetical protein